MKYRDVTIFDGHAYVTGSTVANFEIPVSGFNTVQARDVGIKLGIMAGEGDRNITGDKFQILKQSNNTFIDLSHSGNSTSNFFNSSIQTGGNTRSPNLLNNTGLDISMFNITNNTVITNNQTSTKFKYSSTQDTYIIFVIAMAVDAYIPEIEGLITATTINNVPITSQPYTALPGQEIGLNIDIKNLGTEAINDYKLFIPMPYNATYVPGSAVGTILTSATPSPNNIYFDSAIGATGSLVWDYGTLPLPLNPNTLLAKLSFKIKATVDCQILSNASCSNTIILEGVSGGKGAITNIAFSGIKFIKGHTQNGICVGEPIAEPLSFNIDGTNYVSTNCQNTTLIRNFSYCSDKNSVSPVEISSNFPTGSLFFDSFPITINSVQFTASNPFPLVAGSNIKYFAVPPGNSDCNFPFTIAKCKKIVANDDTGIAVNGLTGETSFTNVLINDTLNGILVTPSQVNINFISSTNPGITLSGNNVIVASGTPAGNYTLNYQICEVGNISNCDNAIVTVIVTKSVIDAINDTVGPINGTTGNPNAGNVLTTNGNSPDTLNGTPVTISQVNLTITTPATPINGGSIPLVDSATG